MSFKSRSQSDFTHHQVKVRQEEWDQQLRGLDAGSYQLSAKGAATGWISFNCNCGRHRFWYRYLFTIGGFGLDPEEHVFPKIRNPGLKGCCCKHVIKTLATLRMSSVHSRIAKEMENQGKKKGFNKKMSEAATQKALRDLKVRSDTAVNEASTLAAERDQLKKDKLVSGMSTSLALSIYRDKMTRKDAIAKFAKERKMPIADATELAKQVIT